MGTDAYSSIIDQRKAMAAPRKPAKKTAVKKPTAKKTAAAAGKSAKKAPAKKAAQKTVSKAPAKKAPAKKQAAGGGKAKLVPVEVVDQVPVLMTAPVQRLKLLTDAHAAGIPTFVAVAPVFPEVG